MAAQKPSAPAYARIIGLNLLAVLVAQSILEGNDAFLWMLAQSLSNVILGSLIYPAWTPNTYRQPWYLSAALVFLIGFGTCLHNFNQH